MVLRYSYRKKVYCTPDDHYKEIETTVEVHTQIC